MGFHKSLRSLTRDLILEILELRVGIGDHSIELVVDVAVLLSQILAYVFLVLSNGR